MPERWPHGSDQAEKTAQRQHRGSGQSVLGRRRRAGHPLEILPADTVSFDGESYAACDAGKPKNYVRNSGVQCLQGNGKARGHLIGGNAQLKKLQGTKAALTPAMLQNAICFYEDIYWDGSREK